MGRNHLKFLRLTDLRICIYTVVTISVSEAKAQSLKGKTTNGAPSVVHVMAKKAQKSKPSGKKAKKEESLSKILKHHAGKHASRAWDWVVRKIFDTAKPVVAAISASNRRIAAAKEGWLDAKDVKFNVLEEEKLRDSNTAMLNLLRGQMTTMMKGKTFSISLPRILDAYAIATVTSGVVANVVAINPTDTAEFATLIALFEEYKMSGLTVDHNPITTGGAGSSTANSFFRVSVADPVSGTALGSVLEGTQYADHELLSQTGAAVTDRCRPPHRWHISFPPGSNISNSGTVASLQDTWSAVVSGSTPPYYCQIKHYWVGSVVTAINVDSAVMFYHMHFRTRV